MFCTRDGASAPWPFAGRDIDWEKVLDYAQIHGVLQFLGASLARFGIRLPHPWCEILATQQQRNAVRAVLQHRACATILQALSQAGVPTVAFKGTSLSKLLYGRVGDRISSDIDILVPMDRVPRAVAAIRELGFDFGDAASRLDVADLLATGNEMIFINGSGTAVELHWRLFEVDRACGFPLEFDGLRLVQNQIANEDLFLILVLHGLAHRWETLKWVVDIDAFVRNVPVTWDSLFRRAAATGTIRATRVALLLAHRVFETPLSQPVSDSVARRLATRYLRGLLAASRVPPVVDFWMQLAARERWIDRWRFVRFVTHVKPWDDGGHGSRLSRLWRLIRQSFRRSPLADVQKIPELRSPAGGGAGSRQP